MRFQISVNPKHLFMKKIWSPLALTFTLAIIISTANAQSVDTRHRAFNYLTGQETMVYSIDMQKIREWGDVETLAKTPEGRKLCKEPQFKTFIESLALGNTEFGVDFNAVWVIAKSESQMRIIIPLCDTANARESLGLLCTVPTQEFDTAHGPVYTLRQNAEKQIAFNDEIIIFQEFDYWSENDFFTGNFVDSMDVALSERLASEMMYALHNHDKIMAGNPTLKEHLEHLTGLDIWKNVQTDKFRFDLDFHQLDLGNLDFCLWPTSSLHATIDNKGVHFTDTYLGNPKEIAEFIKPKEGTNARVDAEMIAHIPASMKSIQFSNMAGKKSAQKSIDTVSFESAQRMDELISRHPWIACNSLFSKQISISRYDDLAEADQIITAYQNDLQDILISNSKINFTSRIEVKSSKDTLAGAIHYVNHWNIKDYALIETVYEEGAPVEEVISEPEFDTMVLQLFEIHWLLKDGLMMQTNDSTLVQELLQEPQDSPLKQHAMAHIDAPFYIVSQMLSPSLEMKLDDYVPTDFLGIFEGVAQGNVFTADWKLNTHGENALKRFLKILMKSLAK